MKPYNTAKIKSQNFMTNISYNGVKEEDLFRSSFVFDIYVLTNEISTCFLWKKKFSM